MSSMNDTLVNVALTRDHGLVVLAATGLAFHGQLSAMGVMKARSKIFKSDDFKNRHATKKLLEEHKQATGEDSLPEGGYPDMGNGRYSEAMTYKEWYDLNNNQRVHQNFLEHLPAVQTYLLLGGLYYPKCAATAAGVFMLGRLLYARGYRQHGPKGRMHGAIMGELAQLFMLGLAAVSGSQLLGLPKMLGFGKQE